MSDPSEAFRAMDQRIQRSINDPFGGACVIVPPGGGKPVELLMLDTAEDEGQFWATIMTRIQMAINENDQKKQVNRTFGVR